jgi:MFS family permease
MNQTEGKKFYGWWIVAGGFILNFIGIGIAFNALGLFVIPVVSDLKFTRGAFSLYFTIAALAMTFAAPVVGKFMEKYDIRAVVGFCTALLGISFAMLSRCSTLTHFYIMAAIVGIGHSGSHIIPVTTMINNWFRVKRGLAMGIVFTATGIGGMIAQPVGEWLIRSYGWRSTYMILGLIILVVSTPTAVFIMRRAPQDMGQTPDGLPETGQDISGSDQGLTLGEFIKTPTFWLLAFMILFLNTLNAGIQFHLNAHFIDVGHSSTFAAAMVSLYLGMTVVGKLSLGKISDAKGLSTGVVLFCGILTAGIALLFGTSLVWVAIMWGIIYGIGNAVQTVMPPLMTASCAGLKHYSTIYAVLAIFQTLGVGGGAPLSGFIYDSTRSYNLGFGIYLVMCILAGLLGYAALKKSVFFNKK